MLHTGINNNVNSISENCSIHVSKVGWCGESLRQQVVLHCTEIQHAVTLRRSHISAVSFEK